MSYVFGIGTLRCWYHSWCGDCLSCFFEYRRCPYALRLVNLSHNKMSFSTVFVNTYLGIGTSYSATQWYVQELAPPAPSSKPGRRPQLCAREIREGPKPRVAEPLTQTVEARRRCGCRRGQVPAVACPQSCRTTRRAEVTSTLRIVCTCLLYEYL